MRLSSFVKSTDRAGGDPTASVTVDADQVIQAISRLQEQQIPEFIKQYLSQVSLEARKVMVQFSSAPYIQRRSGRLVSSIDIFEIPGGVMVGPSVFYARWVYGGTKYMEARPAHSWTFDTVKDRAPTIALALANKIFGGGA